MVIFVYPFRSFYDIQFSYVGDVDTGYLDIIDEAEYYPFGLKHENYAYSADVNSMTYKYKFGGKELQNELGMNVYDFGARNYDPSLGRWMNMDPLAETSRRFSPYAYALNNPVYFIDPDGMAAVEFMDFEGAKSTDPIDYVNSDGKIIGSDGVNDGLRVMIENKNDVSKIENATDNNSTVQLEELESMATLGDKFIPDNNVLKEAINVIDRGVDNGSFREESSIVGFDGKVLQGVTGGMPTMDNNLNIATAEANLPPTAFDDNLSKGMGTSIHLHPTGSLVSPDGGKYFSFSASTPTIGKDDITWSAGKFRTNIIVGKLGQNLNATITRGQVTDFRQTGAAIYRNGNMTPSLQLSVKTINNLINGIKK